MLLVEDDEEVRALAAKALRRQGYAVQVAGEGNEALRLFRERSREIELIVTDVVLPGVSGRELGEAARAIDHEVKILFLSGYAPDLVQRGETEGDIAFLQKPFSLSELARKVREVLDR